MPHIQCGCQRTKCHQDTATGRFQPCDKVAEWLGSIALSSGNACAIEFCIPCAMRHISDLCLELADKAEWHAMSYRWEDK